MNLSFKLAVLTKHRRNKFLSRAATLTRDATVGYLHVCPIDSVHILSRMSVAQIYEKFKKKKVTQIIKRTNTTHKPLT